MKEDCAQLTGERFVEVAVMLPVPGSFTYRVPSELSPPPVGARVLVPFGGRRAVAYVLAEEARPGIDEPRELFDILDDKPAFDEMLLALLRWTARYYHAPLSEVIRTALPQALGKREAPRVVLTPLGRSAAAMPGAEPLLALLAKSARENLSERWLLRECGAPMARILAAERAGYLKRLREPKGGCGRPLTERVAVFVMRPPLNANAVRSREVLARVAQAGEIRVSALRAELGEVSAVLRTLEARGALRLEERRVFRTPHGAFVDMGEPGLSDPPVLMPEQRTALEEIWHGHEKGYQAVLLHGVTSSGKTEVYLRLITRFLRKGRGAIVLVPEIALTPQLVGRFRARFGDQVALLHSGLTSGERLDQWEQVRAGRFPVVIGARSALFAPLPKLGLLVVDEEHETTYKQEDKLRYNARDLALVRGRLSGATVVLGSATPSLESAYNVRRGKLRLCTMRSRINERPMPEVTLVDLRRAQFVDEERALSEPLVVALRETFEAGQQSLVFLNRRGYANFLLCRTCGFIHECPHCSISFTFHQKEQRLLCHYCDERRAVPTSCPKCHGTLLQNIGTGTEKVEARLADLVPGARVARMDRDTTRGEELGKLLRAVRAHEVDILVGTQMVTKGHDFPNVTLVGVLLADQGLKFPDFRSSERTFQLLTQVAGRAGRGEIPGRVLVQTYDPRHYSLRHARDQDFDGFAETELRHRRERAYPPFRHLALVRVTAVGPALATAEAELVARVVLEGARARHLEVLGPTPAPIERLKGRTRWHVLLRGASRRGLHAALSDLEPHLRTRRADGLQIVIDVDPVNFL